MIFKIYTNTWRFFFDSLSLLGNRVFTLINNNFKFFKLFKALRVFRIGQYIRKSPVPYTVKVTANIFKMVLYQFFYLHWLACFTNYVIFFNGPTQYLKNEDGFYVS